MRRSTRATPGASRACPVVAAGLCALLLGCVPRAEQGGALPVERLLGETGSHPGQFSYPRAIDSDGESLWVIDKLARVQRLDPETGQASVWWRMPEFASGKPTGVTAAPATAPGGGVVPAVYVPDTHYHRVMVYAVPPEGAGGEVEPELLASFGRYGTADGEFIYPTDVAVLTDEAGGVERVYVSEYGGNDRVSVFDASHAFLFAFGSLGEGLDPSLTEFQRPQSIAIDQRRRELLVADSCNHRLGRFTLDGELVGWIGSPDHTAGAPVEFDFPYGLAVLDDGAVLVTEFGGCREQVIDVTSGTSRGIFGRAGREAGELATPWGAAVIGGDVFVLDSGNNRVVVTRLPGVRGVRG